MGSFGGLGQLTPPPFDFVDFPNLQGSGHVTSLRSPDYNCIAWAAGDSRRWWWPFPKIPPYYWPVNAATSAALGVFVATFMELGYSRCEDGELERGFEKIAFYADAQGQVTHAARQLTDGRWTSKLGREEDIEHESPEAVEGPVYGRVVAFMKRLPPDLGA